LSDTCRDARHEAELVRNPTSGEQKVIEWVGFVWTALVRVGKLLAFTDGPVLFCSRTDCISLALPAPAR